MASRTTKMARTEIRRQTGTRATPVSKTPRQSGPNYLVAHACFACRVSFKRATPKDNATVVCPNCGGVAVWMGRAFRSPAKTNIEQWKKVQLLVEHGFRFGTYRHGGPPLPARLSQVARFVRDNPDHPCKIRS